MGIIYSVKLFHWQNAMLLCWQNFLIASNICLLKKAFIENVKL